MPFNCGKKKTLRPCSLYGAVTYVQSRGPFGVVAVLLNDALRLGQIGLLGVRVPPVPQVALHVELATLVVETMGDLVTNHVANGAKVHVLRTLGVEEVPLQDAGREFYKRKKISSGEFAGRVISFQNYRNLFEKALPHRNWRYTNQIFKFYETLKCFSFKAILFLFKNSLLWRIRR